MVVPAEVDNSIVYIHNCLKRPSLLPCKNALSTPNPSFLHRLLHSKRIDTSFDILYEAVHRHAEKGLHRHKITTPPLTDCGRRSLPPADPDRAGTSGGSRVCSVVIGPSVQKCKPARSLSFFKNRVVRRGTTQLATVRRGDIWSTTVLGTRPNISISQDSSGWLGAKNRYGCVHCVRDFYYF